MRCFGVTSFGSIGKVPTLDLPNLTVIVGQNGVGKTQFLQAMAFGHVVVEGTTPADQSTGLQQNVPGIVLLRNEALNGNWSAATHQGAGRRLPSGIGKNLRDHFVRVRRRALAPYLEKYAAAAGMSEDQFERQIPVFWKSTGMIQLARDDGSVFSWQPHAAYFDHADMRNAVTSAVLADPSLSPLVRFLETDPIGIPYEWIDADLAIDASAGNVTWGDGDSFKPNLAAIFLSYRDAAHRNRLQNIYDQEEQTNFALNTEDFIDRFGEAPWLKVDQVLKNFELPFSVIPPPKMPRESNGDNAPETIAFMLRQDGSDTPLLPHQLSSGEQVILELALAIFQHDETRINVQKPEILLLDEKDASLHPANVKRWLDAIADGIVCKDGIRCILTTHSPTTVALSPEDAIYEMTADHKYPVKVSKQHAIDRLTVGLPTLAINYAARRQVFSESSIDARHYQSTYDILKQQMDAPFTLSFLSNATVGNCQFVKDMVGHMEFNGNNTVYGIIDWDLKNEPIGRTKVLALNSHYSKDNVFIDPLLIAALLLKNDSKSISDDYQFSDLAIYDISKLQSIADEVIGKVKFGDGADRTVSQNFYAGGFCINVPTVWQKMNGHDLERLVKAAFPELGPRYTGEGKLIDDLIRRVIAGLSKFCPAPIRDVLAEIASEQA